MDEREEKSETVSSPLAPLLDGETTLSEEDEALLDAVWAEIAEEGEKQQPRGHKSRKRAEDTATAKDTATTEDK